MSSHPMNMKRFCSITATPGHTSSLSQGDGPGGGPVVPVTGIVVIDIVVVDIVVIDIVVFINVWFVGPAVGEESEGEELE